MHGPYQLPEATSTTVVIEFVLPVGNLPSGVSCRVLQLQSSQLQVTDAAFYSRLQASHTMHTELDLRNIKIQTRLFKIFGIWPQIDRQTYIHTHVHNAVTLVWGSLRLAPIKLSSQAVLLTPTPSGAAYPSVQLSETHQFFLLGSCVAC